MNKFVLAIASGAIAVSSFAVTSEPVEASSGPFDKIRKKVKEVENEAKKAEDVVETVTSVTGAPVTGTTAGSNYPRTAKGKGHAGRAGPAPAKYTSLTKCANVSIKNAFIAKMGDYTFQSGLSTEERSGLINREPVQPNGGCIMPSMGTYDWLYMEIPTAQLASMKGGYEMQCINTKTGKNANDEARPRWYNLSGKDVMLHTGHSLGYKPTASGSNSDRSTAHKKDLERRGMTMFGFNMPNLHTDAGTDYYCQYYNKGTGQSIVAFQYRRSAG